MNISTNKQESFFWNLGYVTELAKNQSYFRGKNRIFQEIYKHRNDNFEVVACSLCMPLVGETKN